MTELGVEVVKVKLKMQRFGSVVSSINTLKALMKLALCRCSRVYCDVRQQNPLFIFGMGRRGTVLSKHTSDFLVDFRYKKVTLTFNSSS